MESVYHRFAQSEYTIFQSPYIQIIAISPNHLSLFQPQKEVEAKLLKKARLRLQYLHAAIRFEDLYFPPSNKLHALRGFTPTRYAIAVDKQWRITLSHHLALA
ncbi:MAG: type II toxin-antitoxin system RelE/ParE family toxin [Pseudomonadota bacterium]|nr:type II toxin-antitoxin system RelE/ParE family toxin [Pseudomonadota bacterium]